MSTASAKAAPSDAELRRRLPHIQTALPSSHNGSTVPEFHLSPSETKSPTQATHQRFVLTDPVAFKYLEEDPSTQVLDRRRELEGYECYIVEQWACSRMHPTFLITTFTGDPTHKVVVNVLSVPTNQETWSQRLRVYFKALNEYHARPKDTPLGKLMITNLSGFPSSLTVIPVPDGDIRNHREDFFVNENLKRLGCSGRVGLTLSSPNGATTAKFHQLYRTSEKIPLYGAVVELVKLCQAALMLFDKLRPEYVDGLLCDVTEKAINDWWIDIGTEHYNVEPHDGILGPTTVAALLGLLLGARNRLNAYGAPVTKDAFDIENTKRGIAYFQKYQRFEKTRRLDRHTLGKLHIATAKAAAGEGWNVPRAVKSTVAELGGKGGEMVMEMVGRRDRAGIAEVETVDFDTFVQLIYGEHCKWLWYGKRRKTTPGGDILSRMPGGEDALEFQHDDQGGYKWSARRREASIDEPQSARREGVIAFPSRVGTGESQTGSTMSKRHTGRTGDTRSGLGRIRDAVGRRGHHKQASKDEEGFEFLHRRGSTTSAIEEVPPSPSLAKDAADGVAPGTLSKVNTDTPQKADAPIVFPESASPFNSLTGQEFDPERIKSAFDHATAPSEASTQPTADIGFENDNYFTDLGLKNTLETPLPEPPTNESRPLPPLFRRSATYPRRNPYVVSPPDDIQEAQIAKYPRHLSFSIASEAVLTWRPLITPTANSTSTISNLLSKATASNAEATTNGTSTENLTHLALALPSEPLTRARLHVAETARTSRTFTSTQLSALKHLQHDLDACTTYLDDLFTSSSHAQSNRRSDVAALVSRSRAALQDAVRESEVEGARLEYETGVLRGKVEDVEVAVGELEGMVLGVEERVREVAVKEGEIKREKGWRERLWGILGMVVP